MRIGIRMWPISHAWDGRRAERRATVLLSPRGSTKTLGKHPSHTGGHARICLVICAISLYDPYKTQEQMSKIKESHSNGPTLPLMWAMRTFLGTMHLQFHQALQTPPEENTKVLLLFLKHHTQLSCTCSSDSWNLSSPNDSFLHSVRWNGQCYMSLFWLVVPSC